MAGRDAAGVEAVAVIGDDQPKRPRLADEIDPDLARASVLDHVVEGLLGDPVAGVLVGDGQAILVAVEAISLEDDRQPGPALDRRGMGPQGMDEAVLLEAAWSQLEDERPHLCQGVLLKLAQHDAAVPSPEPDRGRAGARASGSSGSSRTVPG